MNKKSLLVLLSTFLFLFTQAQPPTRRFSFETSEVTQPALSMMPDGKSFVFNLLGHLFLLPVDGGSAVQLTFGPYYDQEPVVSPNGKKIAFISNRDGSDGNIFVLDLSTKKITQASNVFQALAPVWSNDGSSIAFLSSLKREEYPVEKVPFFGAGDMSRIFTVAANGTNQKQMRDAGTYVSVYYQPDGSLCYAYTERQEQGPAQYQMPGSPPPPVYTVFEKNGNKEKLAMLKSRTGRMAFTKNKNTFYFIAGGQLKHFALGDTAAKSIGAFNGAVSSIALSPDEKNIIAGADAKLFSITTSNAASEKLNWNAQVLMEVAQQAKPVWKAPATTRQAPSTVMTPHLSPNGKSLIYMAAGFLWQQSINGGAAKKLIDENAYQLDPAFSPDGNKILFASDKQGKREIRIFDLETGNSKTLASIGGYSWLLQPVWSADGKNILYQQCDALGAPYKFIKANADGSDTVTLARSGNNWNGRPHFSADGKYIYYTSRQGMYANLFKQEAAPNAKPVALTRLNRHVHDGLVSPNGKWLAFRRNAEIWIAEIKQAVLTDKDFTLLSKTGGRNFSFAPNSESIIFSEGAKIYRKQLATGSTATIPVTLKLSAPISQPVLISNVQVLDFKKGNFSNPTSIYIVNGRIAWTGDEKGKSISPQAERIDGAGRYVIPGIMDVHTHTAWTNQQITEDRLIAYGVTSVRDVGSRLDIINSLRDKGRATQLAVPRYFAAGDIYEGLVPLWGDAFFEINSKQEARDYVKYSKANGASFIKVYASLPWYIKSEVAAEAARQGLPVAGHGISLEEMVRSINFGITSLEHGGPNNDDIVKLMKYAGTYLDPTPGIFGAGSTLKLGDSTTLDKKFRTFTPEEEIKAARPGRKVSDAQMAAWKITLANLKRIHDNGVSMLDGTDALMTGVFHGPSVHWVLQFFSDAGIANLDVLKIGTIKAAELVGAAKDLGTVEAGKLADILLLNANPLDDIRNTMKIWRVIKNGVVYDPETMRE